MNTHKALVQTPSASNDTLETSIDKATILKDICVYVDVQAKNEDRSDVVVKKVLTLGAKVSKSLGKQCSHMVFKEGNLTGKRMVYGKSNYNYKNGSYVPFEFVIFKNFIKSHF